VRRALKPSGIELATEKKRPPVYRLRIERELIDAFVFRDLAASAHEALRTGDNEAALRLADAALQLWRDDVALPELQDVARIAHEIEDLNDERVNVQVTRFAAALELGRHREIVAALAAEIRRAPTQTPLVEHLMLAYYRCEMTQQALRLCERYKEAMKRRHDLPPHRRIADLEQRIRNDDPTLLLETHQLEPVTRGEIVEPLPAAEQEQHAAWEIPSGLDDTGDGRIRAEHLLDTRLTFDPAAAAENGDTVAAVLAGLRSWAESDAVLGLFDAWEWDPMPRPTGTTYLERFEELESATEAWNYRRYAFERWQQLLAHLDDDFQARVFEAAEVLGMRHWTIPAHDEYALGVALGGARRAPLCRTKWLELLARRCHFAAFGFATSLRPIDERAERPHTTYAPGARHEFDLMHAAALRSSGLGYLHHWHDDEQRVDGYATSWWASSLVRNYERSTSGPPIIGVAAASENPHEHRPRTPETLRFLYKLATTTALCDLSPGNRVVLVTSAIYVPYQQIEALRVLGLRYGLAVETVGHPREWTAAAQAAPLENFQQVGNYLHEIRSAIEACRRLAADFPEASMRPFSEKP
jgi:hypothetical protein